ncbi:MAG: hypothetical protein QOC96_1381 [Acidobacteriota bacterium]|jgi:hypothetical protein|nr:hypothetical protein [Acidobacteriota bacterium]
MEIRVISIPKLKLDKIPELERAFYLHIGHLRNEVAMLHKLLWWNNNNPTDHSVLESTNVAQGFMLVRIIAGKLWEGWDLVQKSYFKSKVSLLVDPKLPLRSKKALNELKSYFGKANIIAMIRNQFAFHYSPQHIRDQLTQVEDTDQLEIYMAPLNVNIFYQFSEIIANSAMLNAVDEADYMIALRKLFDEVLGVAVQFTNFCDGCLEYMILKYLAKKRKYVNWDNIVLTDVPRRDEPKTPFFVRDIKRVKSSASIEEEIEKSANESPNL